MRNYKAKGMECGSGTRRRPIGRDYAAAKDTEGGNIRQKGIGHGPVIFAPEDWGRFTEKK
jgi:hypothetical protein